MSLAVEHSGCAHEGVRLVSGERPGYLTVWSKAVKISPSCFEVQSPLAELAQHLLVALHYLT